MMNDPRDNVSAHAFGEQAAAACLPRRPHVGTWAFADVEELSTRMDLGDALPVLRDSAAVIANLELPITSSTQRWRRTWKIAIRN